MGDMGSLGSAEILVIAVAALIVFGPKRLPEIARKASEILTKTREATHSVTSALDSEFEGVTAPLQTLKAEYNATMKEIKGAATSVGDAAISAGDTKKSKKDESKTTEGDMAVEMPLDDELAGEMDRTPDRVDASTTDAPTPVVEETTDGEDASS